MSEEEDISDRQEIGNLAVWSLSTCKPNFGIDQIRDESLETYWQSDGPQPHLVSIQFPKKMPVTEVTMYLDYKQDESYTPQRISVRAGTCYQDLQEMQVFELEEPVGWVRFPLREVDNRVLRANLIQVAIISNHQNGKDTHVRAMKIFSSSEQWVEANESTITPVE